MKPKRIKSNNTHLFAVRLPKPLVARTNAVRVSQGLTWAQLLAGLFERHIAERTVAEAKGKK